MTKTLENPKVAMRVEREFNSPRVVRVLQNIPESELESLLENKMSDSNTKNNMSQAELILQEIENPQHNLNGLSDEILQSVREFRDNFAFEHDK